MCDNKVCVIWMQTMSNSYKMQITWILVYYTRECELRILLWIKYIYFLIIIKTIALIFVTHCTWHRGCYVCCKTLSLLLCTLCGVFYGKISLKPAAVKQSGKQDWTAGLQALISSLGFTSCLHEMLRKSISDKCDVLGVQEFKCRIMVIISGGPYGTRFYTRATFCPWGVDFFCKQGISLFACTAWILHYYHVNKPVITKSRRFLGLNIILVLIDNSSTAESVSKTTSLLKLHS